jgi:hypothetical protein
MGSNPNVLLVLAAVESNIAPLAKVLEPLRGVEASEAGVWLDRLVGELGWLGEQIGSDILEVLTMVGFDDGCNCLHLLGCQGTELVGDLVGIESGDELMNDGMLLVGNPCCRSSYICKISVSALLHWTIFGRLERRKGGPKDIHTVLHAALTGTTAAEWSLLLLVLEIHLRHLNAVAVSFGGWWKGKASAYLDRFLQLLLVFTDGGGGNSLKLGFFYVSEVVQLLLVSRVDTFAGMLFK